ncbi:hypothetical protein [uncultured Draconibacterium sp.]|uniref:hypothetical protein n=1 Tax=uncultured Draconibacterium sp. TaxID=1573823 RepID=UPI00321708C2
MIEILTVVALFLLFWLLKKSKNNKKGLSTTEKENNGRKQQAASIIGESRFVLGSERKKQVEVKESHYNSSGKLDIEVPLDYEPDIHLIEEQEELEKLGIQNDYSYNLTPDEMMSVVNEVGNDQPKTTPQTGKLLYENENTDWVEQLSSSSDKNANRISSLIDLHLERLKPPNIDMELDDGLMGFDIGKYIY